LSTLGRAAVSAFSALSLAACNQSIEIGSKALAPDIQDSSMPPQSEAGAGSPAGGATDAGGTAGTGDAPDAGGAAGEPANPGILWSSGFETGDVSEWTVAGPVEGGTAEHAATTSVSPERTHSGSSAFKVVFDTTDGQDHSAELYRRVEAGAAYYGAWFLINEAHAPAVYWTIFDFFTEISAGDPSTRRGLWDLNLNSASVYFYDESSKRFVDATPRQPYPVGQWFHLEAYLVDAASGASQISVWQDGVQILDVLNLSMPAGQTLYWGIGTQTDNLTPPACTVYVDDASVSTARVGP
jgi:hypothetical protein